MITPGEGYRLLEVGEVKAIGDEYKDPLSGKWKATTQVGTVAVDYDFVYRRKLPAAQVGGWVSVKERLPEEGACVVVASDCCGFKRLAVFNAGQFRDASTTVNLNGVSHFVTTPPLPTPPKSEAEIAWDKDACIEAMRNKFGPEEAQIKTAYFAGYKAGRGAVK